MSEVTVGQHIFTGGALFRAVSEDEADDLRTWQRFRYLAGASEGKWFATNVVDAAWWGRKLFDIDGRPIWITEAILGTSRIVTLGVRRIEGGRRPAVHVDRDQLDAFNTAVTRITILDSAPCSE